MGQKGFFDIAQRYAGLDAKNDPLARIDEVVPWEDFRPRLEAAWRKPTEERKSPAGRKPWDAVVMFKAIVLCELYNLSDDQVEYQLRDRLSFMRFLGLYHRAECLTHVGDSQAVRSLTQCGEPMRFAMAAPIDLRNDFDSVSLRRLAKRTRDATQSRRLLALAEVYDGGSRTDASRIGGVGLQIIRDWVLRFNARGPDGLVDGKSPGAPSKLNADHRRALAEVVEAGPVPAVDGVVRWRRKDLARWLLETFAISLDETTVGRELKALGFAKISARPRHYAQNELAVEAFKKNFPAELAKIRARLPKGVEIELWWQDEARIGQKNNTTERNA